MTNSVAYSEKLQHPKWQKKRLAILERDNYKCVYCEDGDTQLHIHHKKYSGDPWEVEDKFLETVCKHCHLVISDIKKGYGETVTHVAKSDPKGTFFSKTFALSAITEERAVHLFHLNSDTVISHTVMTDEVVESIYRILFPKPQKTRKKKNG